MTGFFIFMALMTLTCPLFGVSLAGGQGQLYSDNAIASAIYIAEGGSKTNYPYGIKSINVHGNKSYALQICLNTIRHQRQIWLKTSKKVDFIDFLALRYAPPSDSPLNRNWAKNVKYWIGKNANESLSSL
jgi:hypothetical protein